MKMENKDFFGLKVTSFTKEELITSFKQVNKISESKIYYGYSLAVLNSIKKFPEYLTITSGFDIMVTDGRLFYLLAKLFDIKLNYDISIPRLTLLALDVANENFYNVMLLGATNDSNQRAIFNVKENYPNINRVIGIDGYFDFEKRNGLYSKIIAAKPNLLLIGLPTPQKQIFALEIKEKLKGCIIIPCGGMIDVLAGKEKLTPLWIKKLGLASIYRHIQHPNRLPELFNIYWITLKVFAICAYKKFVMGQENISIPSILLKDG